MLSSYCSLGLPLGVIPSTSASKICLMCLLLSVVMICPAHFILYPEIFNKQNYSLPSRRNVHNILQFLFLYIPRALTQVRLNYHLNSSLWSDFKIWFTMEFGNIHATGQIQPVEPFDLVCRCGALVAFGSGEASVVVATMGTV